jgi:hypothetical protein
VTNLEEARARVDKAAIAVGSLLADNLDPGWDESQELESACLVYVRALRAAARAAAAEEKPR